MQKSLTHTYTLVDSGGGRKLEQFGDYLLSRPAAQAVWQPLLAEEAWSKADGVFTREGDYSWKMKPGMPSQWTIEVSGIIFKICPTDFGHLGIFPEQKDSWDWIASKVKDAGNIKVLNLFAYSGGATLAAAKAGAEVCHLDASKGMVTWARENAVLNKAEALPIRWIVDDVNKFIARELRRGSRYDAIILDPPSFGRGAHGEVFKIEEHLSKLLKQCRELLTDNPRFVLFSCHTPGFTPIVMRHLLSQMMEGVQGNIEEGEMLLKGNEKVLTLPSGSFARWSCA